MSAPRKFPWLDDLQYPMMYQSWLDHFDHYVTGDLWTTVATDSGAITMNDAAGGTITLTPSDGTVADNDEIYMKTTKEMFLFADTRIIYGACRLKFAQGNTNQNQVAFGFADAVGANTIVDDAGIKTSFSGMVIHTKPGSIYWHVTDSDGATQNTGISTVVAGGSSWQVLEVWGECTGTRLRVFAKVDGKMLLDSSGLPIGTHDTTFASATEMNAFVGCKQGSATAETCDVDTVVLAQSII